MARIWDMAEIGETIVSVSRQPDPDKLTIFSVFRDEIAFCPAFFDHYRKLGAEQFVIIDDGSVDGTREWLEAQGDACVLTMAHRYGDPLTFRVGASVSPSRAGLYWKVALPHVFFDGRYVTYVDADEFLIPPPGGVSLPDIVARLRSEGATSAVASVVEFFPRDAGGLQGALPDSFESLVAAYPFFEPDPLVTLGGPEGRRVVGRSKTARLFETYGVRPRVVRRGWHRLWMSSRAKKAQLFQKSARHKTPIVLRSADSFQVDSHNANLPPSQTMVLTLAHFVFTAEFADKTQRAMAWGAHASGAAKYRYYAELLDRMRGVPDAFIERDTARFEGPGQLIEAGLMQW
jgi:hypothetical protein